MHQEEEPPTDTPLILTDHACKRAQSRGVSRRTVEGIYANADLGAFIGNGCRSLLVSHRQLARLTGRIPVDDRERMTGVVLVIDPSTNTVITVLHPHRCDARRYWRGQVGRRYRPRRRQRH